VLYSYNRSQQDSLFLNLILVKNSTCFGQTYCPSSGVLIMYSQQLVFYIHGSVHRESNLIIVQKDATVFSLLYFCRQLYVFRVLTLIIRSSYNCNYSFWYWLTGSTAIRSRCWVGTHQRERMVLRSRPGWPVAEAVITVVRAPDDGCQHPKHIELPTEI